MILERAGILALIMVALAMLLSLFAGPVFKASEGASTALTDALNLTEPLPSATRIPVLGADIPIDITGDHADTKHTEADLVRQACGMREEGVLKYFAERDKFTIHLICKMADGTYGDLIVKKVVDKAGKVIQKIEKTAFRPQDGTWKAIMDWLSRKNATPITQPWGAVR